MKRRIIGIAIIVLGIAVVAFPYIRNARDDRSVEQATSQLEVLIEQGEPLSIMVDVEQASGDEMENWDADTEVHGSPLPTPVPVDGKIPLERLGIISIDRIDSKLPIIEGAGKTELKHGIGHLSGTAGIGQTGNCVLAGHRNYTYGSMWNRLDEVQVGDIILIRDADDVTWRYKVYNQLIIEPTERWITDQPKDEKRLTIFTCTPIRVASHRLVFQCRLVEDAPDEAGDLSL